MATKKTSLVKYPYIIDGRPIVWVTQLIGGAVLSGPLGVTGYGNAVFGLVGLIVGLLGAGSFGYYAHVKKGVLVSILAFIGGVIVYFYLTGLLLRGMGGGIAM